jgi:hypothetical protein
MKNGHKNDEAVKIGEYGRMKMMKRPHEMTASPT